VIQALTKFRESASENEEKLQNAMTERDALLSELAGANGRVLELEAQLSASIRASEATRQAMEMAQEESRRWHDQCNALVHALHAYSATPRKLSSEPIPPARHSKHERSKRVELSTIAHSTTKVKDESDTVFAHDPSYQEPHTLGDFNDPRRPDFAQARSGRSLRMSNIYGAQSSRSPHRGVNEEESDDELDGITPAQHLREDVYHRDTVHTTNTDKQRRSELHSGRKRKSPPATDSVKKAKRR